MWMRHLNVYIATACVSFALIAVLFSVLSLLTDYIGPTSPQALLMLLSMCLIISACTTWFRTLKLRSVFVFCLLCYGACLGTVLGLGYITGFIPLAEGDAAMNWTVLAMISGVFLGTALFWYAWEKNAVLQINAKLQAMEGAMHASDTADIERRADCAPFSRFLYTTVTSYTALMTIAAFLADIPGSRIVCDAVFALLGLGICMTVSAVVVMLERTACAPWRIFLVSTAMGAAVACALLMPAERIAPSFGEGVISGAVSAAVSLLTAGAVWLMDGLEAQDINERIRERRADDGKDYRGRRSAEKVR